MPRTVAFPVVILVGIAWLIAGSVAAVLLAAALDTLLAPDGLTGSTIALAAFVFGGAVMAVGFAETYRWLRQNAASRGPGRQARPGMPEPNTLRFDASLRSGGPSQGRSPQTRVVPNRPWNPTSGMPAASSAGTSTLTRRAMDDDAAGWRRATTTAAPASRGRAAIPGAVTVSRSRLPGTRAGALIKAQSRGPLLATLVALSAGIVFATELDAATVEAGMLVIPVGLVLVAGAIGGSDLATALFAAAPVAIVSWIMADSGRLEQGAAVESTGLAFLAAYIVNGFGGALGRLVGVRRP